MSAQEINEHVYSPDSRKTDRTEYIRTAYDNIPTIDEGALVAVWYVVCRICNREVAGSNLGQDYFAPRSTQPSIPPGSVNKYQL